jgi:hypothetical protein
MSKAYSFQWISSSVLLALLTACGGGVTSGVDGDWDVVADSKNDLKASTIKVSSGKVSGELIDDDEGSSFPNTDNQGVTIGTCVRAKARTQIELTATADSMSGVFTEVREYTGSCPDFTRNRTSTSNVTGVRSVAKASSDTNLNGSWNLTLSDFKGKWTAEVDGLKGSTAITKDGSSKTTNGQFTIVDGLMTMTFDGESFSMRKK